MARPEYIDQKVDVLSEALLGAEIPHAFGGAIALAYYGEPRSTIDIDVNIFLTADHAESVLQVLRPLGVEASPEDVRQIADTAQSRLDWDGTKVDLFFAEQPFHLECAQRIRSVPFVDRQIQILGAEDLLIFKIAFNRRKDWLDVEQVLFARAGSLDLNRLRRTVRELLGPDDARVSQLDETIQRILGPGV